MSIPTKRKCKNWLLTLLELVEDTEAPRDFWMWSGIFTLTAALQRRVWLPYGFDPIFPNLFVILVAPPGRCRKGGPVSLSRNLLHDVRIHVSVDSMSKRALTKEMAELGKSQYFQYRSEDGNQEICPNTAIAIVSKEMSSLLALDPKAMIEALTDLFDAHEKWAYKTSGVGEDFLYGVCINMLAATTPSWIAANLPEEAIGGGFTSRLVLVHGEKKYKRVPIPSLPDPEMRAALVYDLGRIANFVGEFRWGGDARQVFEEWYGKLGSVRNSIKNQKLHSFVERMHIHAIKVAMAIRVAYSDELIIGPDDIGRAIDLVNGILSTAGKVFQGHGTSDKAGPTERIRRAIRTAGEVTFSELLRWHYNDLNKSELWEVVNTLEGSGMVTYATNTTTGETTIKWKPVVT